MQKGPWGFAKERYLPYRKLEPVGNAHSNYVDVSSVAPVCRGRRIYHAVYGVVVDGVTLVSATHPLVIVDQTEQEVLVPQVRSHEKDIRAVIGNRGIESAVRDGTLFVDIPGHKSKDFAYLVSCARIHRVDVLPVFGDEDFAVPGYR